MFIRTACNQLIDEYNLNMPYVEQHEVTNACNNSLSHLGDGTPSSVTKDNPNKLDYARVVLTKICIDRAGLNFDIDHNLARANGGANHYTNLYPLPAPVNKLKGDANWSEEDTQYMVEIEDERRRRLMGIPEGYVYENCWDWILRNYSM